MDAQTLGMSAVQLFEIAIVVGVAVYLIYLGFKRRKKKAVNNQK